VAHARGAKVKVILENAYLTDQEKVAACKLCEEAGADWVKTSTGFAPGGATLEDLKLMRRIDEMHLKRPFYGSRRLTDWLREEGQDINRKRVQRLSTMGKWLKLTVISAACAVVVVGGAAWLYVHLGKRGTSRLEQWIGQQIVGVVQGHLNCTAGFETLDYQAPKTVEVTGLSLSRDGNEIVGASRMLIELGERPRLSEPIQIQLIEVDDPHMMFKAAPGGGFVGWNNLVRSEVVENPDSVEAGKRLSDVLVLRHVEVKNGRLVYERADGNAAMKLTGLGFTMDTVPEVDDPGWYTLNCAFGREGLSEFNAEARLNLDTAVIEIKRIEGALTLDKEQYSIMPPPVETPANTCRSRAFWSSMR